MSRPNPALVGPIPGKKELDEMSYGRRLGDTIMTVLFRSALVLLLATPTACGARSEGSENPSPTATQTVTHPLLVPWTGPHGGVPPFDRMELSELESGFREGIAAHLAELDAIANDPQPPTFDNTIVAFQRAGAPIRRLETIWGVWRGNVSSPEFRDIDRVLSPLRSEYESKITQNRMLFDRIRSVYEDPNLQQRSEADRRLVKLMYDRFAMRGATVEGADAQRYSEIQKRLAELHTTFANNVLADEESYVVFLTSEQLGGLPDSVVAAAAGAAQERGKPGQFAITNTRSSMEPFLTYSTQRPLREQVWRNYYGRGDNGDAHDNNAIIAEILLLRDERVGLLGFDDYASWRLQDRMAKTPQRAMALMESVWPAAVARAKEATSSRARATPRDTTDTCGPTF